MSSMQGESIVPLVVAGRYWILVPLALLEGPTVAFVTGVLASRGYVNLWVAYGLFIAKDLVVDGAFYLCGRFFAQGRLVATMLRRANVTAEEMEHVHSLWNRRGWRTMAIGKLSWGLTPAFLAAAGMVAVPPARFFRYAAGVALVQYAALLLLGYSLGREPSGMSTAIRLTQYLAAGAVVIGLFYLRRRMRSQ